jgi:hypothetical protein
VRRKVAVACPAPGHAEETASTVLAFVLFAMIMEKRPGAEQ